MDKLHKTDEPCDCGAISALLNEPNSGFKIDEHYGIVLETEMGAVWMVYHCIFCGGRLPDGSKPIWYPRLDEAEKERLQQLVAGIEMPEAAYERLGTPDYDAFMVTYTNPEYPLLPLVVSEHDSPDVEGYAYNEELSRKCRNIEYYNLSEHANIEFYFDETYGLEVRILLKSISPRHVEDDLIHSR